jgi:hypothetical protein
MEIIGHKKINLTPIGDVRFRWNKLGRKPKGTCILIREIGIHHDTRQKINQEDYDKLMESMKENGTDLLTDGKKFYTTFWLEIGEISHPLFETFK